MAQNSVLTSLNYKNISCLITFLLVYLIAFTRSHVSKMKVGKLNFKK